MRVENVFKCYPLEWLKRRLPGIEFAGIVYRLGADFGGIYNENRNREEEIKCLGHICFMELGL